VHPSHRLSIVVPLFALALLAASAFPAGAFPLVPGYEFGAGRTGIRFDEELSIWDNGMTNAFTAGIRLKTPESARFGLLTGVRYTHVGNRVEFEPDPTAPSPMPIRGHFEVLLEEVRVPVLLRVAPLAHSGLRVSLGPEVAFVAGAHSKDDWSWGSIAIRDNQDLIATVYRSRLDARAGLAWAFPLGSHTASAELRATRALTPAGIKDRWVSKWYPYDMALVLSLDR
jgi:hypothetical protein